MDPDDVADEVSRATSAECSLLSLGDRTCKYEYAPYYHPNMIGN